MAKKVRENLEQHLDWLREGNMRIEDVEANHREINDLIFKMWQNDLISDKVKDECYEVVKELGYKLIREIHKIRSQA